MHKYRIALLAALTALSVPAVARAAPIQAADNEDVCINQNVAPLAMLAADHASVMRIVLPPSLVGLGVNCVQQARAAGYKIYLSLIYDNDATPQQDAAFFASALPQYGPLWAVSVGNEQTLQRHGSTPAQYRAVWDAVEPVLPADAIHVFAEGTPWDENFIKQTWAVGGSAPAGVGAIAYHCYNVTAGTLDPGPVLAEMPEFGQWAAGNGLPLWCSEETRWLDSPSDLAEAEAATPNLGLVSDYYWPKPASAPAWVPPTVLSPLPPVAHHTASAVESTQPAAAATAASPQPSHPVRHRRARHHRKHHPRHHRKHHRRRRRTHL